MQNTKLTPRKILVGTLIVVTIGATIVYPIYYVFLRLPIAGYQNKRVLNTLTFISGEKTEAIAVPDGDWLTATTSVAYANFATNGTAREVNEQISKNMSSQGYRMLGEYNAGNYDTQVKMIEVMFKKNDTIILVQYILDKPYDCPGGQVCGTYDSEAITQVALLDRQIKKVEVRYNPENNPSYYYDCCQLN
jgi:hypothetical protein